MASASSTETVEKVDDLAKPPFLRRVRIRGYKSIAFCDVTLEPLTILVGRNASGKSNFLEALAFLCDVLKVGVNEAVKRHGGAEAIPCRAREDRVVSIEIESGYTIADDTDCWKAAYRIEIDFPKKRPAKIRHEELRIQQDEWWVGYTNESGRVTLGAADDQPRQRVWRVKDRPFLDSYNDTPVPEFSACLASLTVYNFHPDAIRRLQKPNPGWFLERDGSNLASVIETTRENDEGTIDRVGRYLSAVTESVELLGVARYGEYETPRFQVASDGQARSLEFDAAGMSDGTLRALAALVAAFQIVLPQGYPSLVAIEEPETALHPAAMRALVAALDEATLRTQILITTHSPDLLDAEAVKPENVRVVEYRDGCTVIAPLDEANVSIVRDHLSTLGGLERDRQLEPDLDDLDRQADLARQERDSS